MQRITMIPKTPKPPKLNDRNPMDHKPSTIAQSKQLSKIPEIKALSSQTLNQKTKP